MFLKRLALAGLIAGTGLAALSLQTSAQQSSTAVTFHKDVLPILQKNCQTCHRPGEIAPMSFLSYNETRPWAKAIKAAVISRQMPPWFADPAYGHFANDRTSERCGDQDACGVGRRWNGGGQSEGRSRAARVPRRLEHPAGHDHRNAEGRRRFPQPAPSTTRASSSKEISPKTCG